MKQGFDDYHDYLKRLVSRKQEREKKISKRQTNRKITLPKPFFNQLSKKENAKVAREKKTIVIVVNMREEKEYR